MEPPNPNESVPGTGSSAGFSETPTERAGRWFAVNRAIQNRLGGVGKGTERSERSDKFTERAKRVLTHSQREAQRLNHNYIGTEHLLLGLLKEQDGVAAKVLEEMGVTFQDARDQVAEIIGRGDKPAIGNISMTPRTKKVIDLAVEESRRLKHGYIGTEHLLLGLLREGEGVAAGMLVAAGIDLERARRQVVEAVAQAPAGGRGEGSGGTRDNVVSCRLGDEDLAAIDTLIEAGIRSTRSDAASWLIHAGVQANKELFDRVRSTVEEIRRLREQTQRMAEDLMQGKQPPAGEPDPSGSTV